MQIAVRELKSSLSRVLALAQGGEASIIEVRVELLAADAICRP
jgi:antitoxin (DNA-binding transcriptional repressor) of toxin-antitoxin stability system